MLMFVCGLKLEKILKMDGAPEVYLVSSVRRVVRVIPGTLLLASGKFFVCLVSSRRNN